MTKCIALIVGAGHGARFGGEMPKQYHALSGRTVIDRSVNAFGACPGIDAVRCVIHPDYEDLYHKSVQDIHGKLLQPVPGGATRQESVRLGLQSLSSDNCSKVLIHDAARPFIDAELIGRIISALDLHDGAIPALPVNDTLKKSLEGERILSTVDRSVLWRAQTPQGFLYEKILKAHVEHADKEVTDDAALAEKGSLDVIMVDGDEDNVKITTQADMERARRHFPMMDIRTGFGMDAHRFSEGDKVVLCGVGIPHASGLEGHSDADVGLHALTDALLGAIGEGDIGQHFPPGESDWRDAGSDLFVRKAATLIAEKGGRIQNVDITLVCEVPKIGPHRETMRATVSEILQIELSRVSIKATTTERMGFTGRKEGIAAQAVATVSLPSADAIT